MADLSKLSDEELKALRLKSVASTATHKAGPSLALKPDQVLGFTETARQPYDRIAQGLESGANYLGISDAVNELGKRLGLPPDTAAVMKTEREKRLSDAADKGWRPGGVGSFLGSIAGELPLAMTPLGKNPAALGAASGVLSGDREDLPGMAGEALMGAVGGKAGDLAAKGTSTILNPVISKAKRTLADAKVRMTPGQIAGGGFQRLEDGIVSLPGVGDAPRRAQQQSFKDLNLAAAGRALEPVGKKLPPSTEAGFDSTRITGDILGNEYDNLLSGLTIKGDQTSLGDLYKLQQDAKLLPKKEAQAWSNIVQREISLRMKSASGKASSMTGEAFKEAESAIKEQARRFSNSGDAHQKNLGDILGRTGDMLHGMLERSAGPDKLAKLKQIDEGWANLARVEIAGGKAATNKELPGVFSPSQLAQGVREADPRIRKRGSARGEALMQDLSSAGTEVLPSKVPDSGTAYRHLATIGLPALAAGGYESDYLSPEAALALALVGGAYSKPGMAAFQKAAFSKRPAAAKYLAKALTATKAPTLIGSSYATSLQGPPQ